MTRTIELTLRYACLLVLPLAILLAALRAGHSIPVREFPSGIPVLATSEPALGFPGFIAGIALIVLAARALGSLVTRVGQPRVIGEIVAGILLGPSFLGWVSPRLAALLFPSPGFLVLDALSQLGLVLFMFLVGLELDLTGVRRQGQAAILISAASIVWPLSIGTGLAVYLYPRLSSGPVRFIEFALFISVAMSITAFPVLARILREGNRIGSRLGLLAIACAALNDVAGWCLLAYVVGIVRVSQSAMPVWKIASGLAMFLAFMFTIVKKLLTRLERAKFDGGELSDNWKAAILLLILLSALVTDALGLHLLFGAFLAGAVMPRNRVLVAYLVERFESLTLILLLPLYFAYTGLRTSLGALRTPRLWEICLLIIVAAVAGKLGGAGLAARASGLSWRDSFAVGALMNTRGLMEIIVLNIGLDLHVISSDLFTMMVVMALATTMMTPPLLRWSAASTG